MKDFFRSRKILHAPSSSIITLNRAEQRISSIFIETVGLWGKVFENIFIRIRDLQADNNFHENKFN